MCLLVKRLNPLYSSRALTLLLPRQRVTGFSGMELIPFDLHWIPIRAPSLTTSEHRLLFRGACALRNLLPITFVAL